MAIEIEKKYRLDDRLLVELSIKLAELGAPPAAGGFEENYLYRGGILNFRSAVLRLRKTGETTILAYKERFDGDSGFKQQIEFETEVSDAAATENIIKSLGYNLTAVYEKHRKTWLLAKTEIALDTLPFGFYLEIEGDAEDILAAEKLLEIENLETEPRGYPQLTIEFGVSKDGVFEARFGVAEAGED